MTDGAVNALAICSVQSEGSACYGNGKQSLGTGSQTPGKPPFRMYPAMKLPERFEWLARPEPMGELQAVRQYARERSKSDDADAIGRGKQI